MELCSSLKCWYVCLGMASSTNFRKGVTMKEIVEPLILCACLQTNICWW